MGDLQNVKDPKSPARARLAQLFDEGKFQEFGAYIQEKDAQAAVVTAFGYVNGDPVYAFAQDQSIHNGAVGEAQAAKISKVFTLAAKTGAPVIGVYDSNGAFMDGSAASLNAYSLILKRTSQLSGVVPVISLVLGVCAGSAAIAAAAADFVVMTEDAELFLTPAFEKGAGSAAAAAANGTAAAVEADEAAAIAKVRALVNLMPVNNMATVPCMEFDAPAAASGSDLEGYVSSIADGGSVVALYEGFGGAAYTALATVAGTTVGIAATNKTDAKLTEDDCDKLARFMRTCDAFSIPVITLVDTLGFGGSVETELKGAVKAVTRLAGSYAEATTAKIAVVTGTAAGPLFVALAGKSSNSDFAYALEGACIAPMAPESAVEFLWHDRLKGADDLNAKRKALAKEYAETVASADKAAALGVVDDVIGAADLRATVTAALSMLEGKRVTNLPKKHSNFPF